ncbi:MULTISPECIES: hypothetical protein [unclassified Streptomyces]|uniref:hypothetical protein n=1 Tax=unclassified Streptomyces TaxID=2593676 RepID=UPI001EF0231B|nr:hypothetical protein [Streptomyces sp. ACT-1]
MATHARVERRLEQIRARTAAHRAALLPQTPPLRPQQPPDTDRTSHRPPTR